MLHRFPFSHFSLLAIPYNSPLLTRVISASLFTISFLPFLPSPATYSCSTVFPLHSFRSPAPLTMTCLRSTVFSPWTLPHLLGSAHALNSALEHRCYLYLENMMLLPSLKMHTLTTDWNMIRWEARGQFSMVVCPSLYFWEHDTPAAAAADALTANW